MPELKPFKIEEILNTQDRIEAYVEVMIGEEFKQASKEELARAIININKAYKNILKKEQSNDRT